MFEREARYIVPRWRLRRGNVQTIARQVPVVASNVSVFWGLAPAVHHAVRRAEPARVRWVCAWWPREYRTRNDPGQKSTATFSLLVCGPNGSPVTGCANRN